MGQKFFERDDVAEAMSQLLSELDELYAVKGNEKGALIDKFESWVQSDRDIDLDEFCRKVTDDFVEDFGEYMVDVETESVGKSNDIDTKIVDAAQEVDLTPKEIAETIESEDRRRKKVRNKESKTDKWVRHLRTDEATLEDVNKNVSQATYYKIRRIVRDFDHVESDRPFREKD